MQRKKVKKRVNTGEAQVFRAIWDERPHTCEHCGGYLGEDAKTFFFAHIQRKSQSPGLRLIKMNIRLLCLECHTSLDNREYAKLEQLEGSRPGVYVGSIVPPGINKIKTNTADFDQFIEP